MFVVFQFVKWTLAALAAGVYPELRHDYSPFGDDDRRVALAGTKMRSPAALVQIKADWAEVVHSFGFPQWNSAMRPCPFCNGSPLNLYDICRAEGMAQLPWRPNSAGEYDAACARCEIQVVLDRTGHRKISAYLALIPTKGVLLTIDMPVYGLVKGDRLEPSIALFDVMAFDSLDQFPHPVTFWRVSRETNAKHRNPIFDETIGVSVEDTLTVDSLHAVFLGPMRQSV